MSSPLSSLFKQGFPDHRRPYQITVLDRDTTHIQTTTQKFGGGVWQLNTNIQINLVVKRLKRDNIDPRLGNMEREVMRLICQYKQNDIEGIDKLVLTSMERVYEANDNLNWSKSRYITRVMVSCEYFKANIESFNP